MRTSLILGHKTVGQLVSMVEATSSPEAERELRRRGLFGGITALVAAEVRAEMARKQVTGSLLGERIGMSQQSVSLRIRGKVPFSVAELDQVAKALGVRMSAWFPDEA